MPFLLRPFGVRDFAFNQKAFVPLLVVAVGDAVEAGAVLATLN